jgi:hypothetical protein
MYVKVGNQERGMGRVCSWFRVCDPSQNEQIFAEGLFESRDAIGLRKGLKGRRPFSEGSWGCRPAVPSPAST